MITLSKIKNVILETSKRILKVQQFGPKTAIEASPFGEDSSPLKDMTAIFAKTSESGEAVIIGYINKNQVASQGEKRIYSLKPDGTLSFSLHLKNDGTCEIGGNTDNMIKFIPLDVALKSQDNLINIELGKIATAISTLGGTYVPSNVSTNIDASKLTNVKTS